MKMLIIEDDVTSGQVLARMLQSYGTCDIALNGRDGLQAFKSALEISSPFQIIFLDIMLPEIDGQEVLKAIRKIEADHNIYGFDGVKVIMTTALDDNRNILQAFRSQCEGYLVKPILKDKLKQEISRLCNTTNN